MAKFNSVKDFIETGSMGLFSSYNNNFEFKRGYVESYEQNLEASINFGKGYATVNEKLERIDIFIEKSDDSIALKNIDSIEYDIKKSSDIAIYFGDESGCKLYL